MKCLRGSCHHPAAPLRDTRSFWRCGLLERNFIPGGMLLKETYGHLVPFFLSSLCGHMSCLASLYYESIVPMGLILWTQANFFFFQAVDPRCPTQYQKVHRRSLSSQKWDRMENGIQRRVPDGTELQQWNAREVEKRPRVKKAPKLQFVNDRKKKPWLHKQKLLWKEEFSFFTLFSQKGKAWTYF